MYYDRKIFVLVGWKKKEKRGKEKTERTNKFIVKNKLKCCTKNMNNILLDLQ